MEQRVVTIIGGTGFVGRYVVKLLAASGYTVRVLARHPEAALHLKTAGSVGQIVLMHGDLTNPATLLGKIEDSYAVINLAGILFESGKQTFTGIHAHGAEKLAQMAKAAGVQRFIQMSALGVDKARGSVYARSKMLGEKAVLAAFPEATILRPSVIFGPEDNFFNQFARIASLAPAMPLLGGGRMRFQPVYVGDIAKAAVICLTQTSAMGQTYELGGPHVYSFREILEYIMRTIGKQRPFVPVPLNIASVIGLCSQILPNPPLTHDQVKLLKHDNVVSGGAATFASLGISPTAVEIIVPQYLARYNPKATAA